MLKIIVPFQDTKNDDLIYDYIDKKSFQLVLISPTKIIQAKAPFLTLKFYGAPLD